MNEVIRKREKYFLRAQTNLRQVEQHLKNFWNFNILKKKVFVFFVF